MLTGTESCLGKDKLVVTRSLTYGPVRSEKAQDWGGQGMVGAAQEAVEVSPCVLTEEVLPNELA